MSRAVQRTGNPNTKIWQAEQQTLRILVVDDERPVRELLECFLQRLGCQPTLSANAREALAVAHARDFDLVISDYSMPGLTGIELYRRFAAEIPRLCKHFILITGNGFSSEIVGFLAETHAEFIEKPFRLSQLEAAIEKVLRRPELQRS